MNIRFYENRKCFVIEVFSINGRHYSRIKEQISGEVHVVLTKELTEKKVALDEDVVNEIKREEGLDKAIIRNEDEHAKNLLHITDASQVVLMLPKIEEPTDRKIKAVNFKGKTTMTTESKLADFCSERNLELESVILCLNGQQKTHKKWGFSYLA